MASRLHLTRAMAASKRVLSLSLGILTIAAMPALALAERKSDSDSGGGGGVLSRNVSAVSKATSSSNDSGGSSSSSSSDDSYDSGDHYDHGYYGYGGHHHGYAVSYGHVAPPAFVTMPYPTYTRGPEVSLYLGLQNVKDAEGSEASTAAASVSVRASVDDFGIGLSDTIYYETLPGMDPLTMHLWSLDGLFRIARLGAGDHTAVWLTGGFAGMQSADAFQLFGGALGAEIAHNFGDAAGLEGSARIIALQEGMRAIEYRVGVAASVVRLSYRYLKLNVDAPALKGPELGVALHF